MKKLSFKYRLFRFFFGLVLMFVGFKGLVDSGNLVSIIEKNNDHLNQKEAVEALTATLGENLYNLFANFLEIIKSNANDLVLFIYLLILFGGLLCCFGHKISKFFLLTGILLDIFIIHNVIFFSTDNGRGLMLKYIAYIGGISYII